MLESVLAAPSGASILSSTKTTVKNSSESGSNSVRKSITDNSSTTTTTTTPHRASVVGAAAAASSSSGATKCPFEVNLKEIYSKLLEIDDQQSNREAVYEVLFSDNVNLEVQNRIDCSTLSTTTTTTVNVASTTSNNVNSNNKQPVGAAVGGNKSVANVTQPSVSAQSAAAGFFSTRMLDFSDWNDGIGEWSFVNPYPCIRNYVSGLNKRRNRNKDPIDFDEELGLFVPASVKPKPIVVATAAPAATSQVSPPGQISHYSSQTSSKHLDSLLAGGSTNHQTTTSTSSPPNLEHMANKSIPPLTTNSLTSGSSHMLFQHSPVSHTHHSHFKDQKMKESSDKQNRTLNHHNPSLNTLNNPIASERLIKELQKIIESNGTGEMTSSTLSEINESLQLNPTCYKKKLSYPGGGDCSYRPDSASLLNNNSGTKTTKTQLPIKAAALPFSEYYNINSTLAAASSQNYNTTGSLSSHMDTSDLKQLILNGPNQTSYRLSSNNYYNGGGGGNLMVKAESESSLAIVVAPSKKVLPPVTTTTTTTVSNSSGNSSQNNTLLISPPSNTNDNENHPSSSLYYNNNNNSHFYRNILGQNLLSNKNGQQTETTTKPLIYSTLNKHATSNSNLLYLDEDGEPVTDSDKNSFFYVNSIGKNAAAATRTVAAVNAGAKSYKPYKMRPNAFKNQPQSSNSAGGAYSGGNNMSYLTNQVLTSNNNTNGSDLISHSGSMSGNGGGNGSGGGGLPPLLAGKRIQMPLGPHRYL